MTASQPTFAAVRPGCDQPVVDLGAAPLPTARTLRRRRSIPMQLFRFVSFSLRIMRMVRAGH